MGRWYNQSATHSDQQRTHMTITNRQTYRVNDLNRTSGLQHVHQQYTQLRAACLPACHAHAKPPLQRPRRNNREPSIDFVTDQYTGWRSFGTWHLGLAIMQRPESYTQHVMIRAGASFTVLISYFPQSLTSSICYSLLAFSWSIQKLFSQNWWQPSYLCSLLSFPSHRSTRSSSIITLSRPSLTSRLKIANRSYHHSAPVLWNSLPSDLRQVAYHVTPSPILNSPVFDLLNSLFLKS